MPYLPLLKGDRSLKSALCWATWATSCTPARNQMSYYAREIAELQTKEEYTAKIQEAVECLHQGFTEFEKIAHPNSILTSPDLSC